MQTILRLPPPAANEIGRVLPANPAGEERFGSRHGAGRLPAEGQPSGERAGTVARTDELAPVQNERARSARRLPNPAEYGPGPLDTSFGDRGRSFSRDDLLASASFQAQHLGQTPPYRNEALARAAAAGAYREAAGLSVQYFGSFTPLDIRV